MEVLSSFFIGKGVIIIIPGSKSGLVKLPVAFVLLDYVIFVFPSGSVSFNEEVDEFVLLVLPVELTPVSSGSQGVSFGTVVF